MQKQSRYESTSAFAFYFVERNFVVRSTRVPQLPPVPLLREMERAMTEVRKFKIVCGVCFAAQERAIFQA